MTAAEWQSAQWQRAHSVTSVAGFREVFGAHLDDELATDMQKDQLEFATMPLRIPPHMLNTMTEHDLRADPVRRYMAPASSEREREFTSHPLAKRDSLGEAEQWAVEGLTHRYPTKVLAEITSTCAQYCAFCTRMDLVGTDTPQLVKYRFAMKQPDRYEAMLDYLRRTPAVRDVVVSGGDVANVSPRALESFVTALIQIPHIKDIRLATKSLIALPQHFLQSEVLEVMARLGALARAHDVSLAVHTHANHASQLTPLVTKATKAFLEFGFRDVRNQGVLLRGINDTQEDLLELSFTLLDRVGIMPYYVFLGDIVPSTEHWRTSIADAIRLQEQIMGYLPGFATPRVTVDVPYLGKRWVHQIVSYDRVRGVSTWSADGHAYYDPIHSLPEEGKAWWREHVAATSTA